MSIRTTEQLSDALASEIVWRKKELTALRMIVESRGITPDRRTAVLRGAIALLYAHWEGFIKTSGRAYLEFVHYQRLTYKQLTSNFIALSTKEQLSSATTSSRINSHIQLVNFFLDQLHTQSNIPYKSGVNTKANLSAKVLKDVIDSLGLNYTEFATKEKLIDEQLLKQRNEIAHGEYLISNLDSYLDLYEQVLAMMENFRNQIDNAAVLRKYLAA